MPQSLPLTRLQSPRSGGGPGGRLTWASCRRSSSRVTVMERSQVYFLRSVSCSFRSCSSASRTSEKNWTSRKRSRQGSRAPPPELPPPQWAGGAWAEGPGRGLTRHQWAAAQDPLSAPAGTEGGAPRGACGRARRRGAQFSPGSRRCSPSDAPRCSSTAEASSSTASAGRPGRTAAEGGPSSGPARRPGPAHRPRPRPPRAPARPPPPPPSAPPTSTVGRAGWSSRSRRSPVLWISLIFFSFSSSSRIRA